MSPLKIIKLLFFASALAWMLVNLAGIVGALLTDGSTMHIGAHIFFAIACAVVAWFLRPRRQPAAAIRDDDDPRRLELLESELSDLQRKLDEQQRSLEFTEQLLAKKPESRKDQP